MDRSIFGMPTLLIFCILDIKYVRAYWGEFSCKFVAETLMSGHGGLGTYSNICEAMTNTAVQSICCSTGIRSCFHYSLFLGLFTALIL
jgi:hypothetical protein